MSRSSWTAQRKRVLALPLFSACAFLLVTDPAAIAGHRSTTGDDDLPSISQRYDPLVVALNGTRGAYLRGDFEVARSWFAFAAVLLENATPAERSSRQWPRSNADQLLVMLQMYDWYARGQHPELDAQHDALVGWLYDIDALNRSALKPDRIGTLDVRYDLFSRLVREMGDLRVDYDLFTWQITQIGPYRIHYDLFTRMPRSIGGIEIHYDLLDRYPDTIADVRIR